MQKNIYYYSQQDHQDFGITTAEVDGKKIFYTGSVPESEPELYGFNDKKIVGIYEPEKLSNIIKTKGNKNYYPNKKETYEIENEKSLDKNINAKIDRYDQVNSKIKALREIYRISNVFSFLKPKK